MPALSLRPLQLRCAPGFLRDGGIPFLQRDLYQTPNMTISEDNKGVTGLKHSIKFGVRQISLFKELNGL